VAWGAVGYNAVLGDDTTMTLTEIQHAIEELSEDEADGIWPPAWPSASLSNRTSRRSGPLPCGS
jgi:hypothetical protein